MIEPAELADPCKVELQIFEDRPSAKIRLHKFSIIIIIIMVVHYCYCIVGIFADANFEYFHNYSKFCTSENFPLYDTSERLPVSHSKPRCLP